MTAADPRQVGERRFENLRSFGAVATTQRCHPRAESWRHVAWRQATITPQIPQSGDAGLQIAVVAGGRFGESGVEIGKGETSVREMPPRMRRHLRPFPVERWRRVIKPPAP